MADVATLSLLPSMSSALWEYFRAADRDDDMVAGESRLRVMELILRRLLLMSLPRAMKLPPTPPPPSLAIRGSHCPAACAACSPAVPGASPALKRSREKDMVALESPLAPVVETATMVASLDRHSELSSAAVTSSGSLLPPDLRPTERDEIDQWSENP